MKGDFLSFGINHCPMVTNLPTNQNTRILRDLKALIVVRVKKFSNGCGSNKTLSKVPFGRTFVSPEMSFVSLSLSVWLKDSMIFFKSSIKNPSSIIKLAVKYLGFAPLIATSLQLPQTLSLPISPPGKKRGEIV